MCISCLLFPACIRHNSPPSRNETPKICEMLHRWRTNEYPRTKPWTNPFLDPRLIQVTHRSWNNIGAKQVPNMEMNWSMPTQHAWLGRFFRNAQFGGLSASSLLYVVSSRQRKAETESFYLRKTWEFARCYSTKRALDFATWSAGVASEQKLGRLPEISHPFFQLNAWLESLQQGRGFWRWSGRKLAIVEVPSKALPMFMGNLKKAFAQTPLLADTWKQSRKMIRMCWSFPVILIELPVILMELEWTKKIVTTVSS